MKKIYIYLLIALAGFSIFLLLYPRVYPSAKVTVEISKESAETKATEFLLKEGYGVDSYTTATIFRVDTAGALFLEKSWGRKKLAEVIQKDPQWVFAGYSVRFFKPLQKEEFVVSLNAKGEVTEMSHNVDETGASAKLTKVDALANVEKFALRHNLSLTTYEEKEYQVYTLPARIDHVFTYADKNTNVLWSEEDGAGTGELRLEFVVLGDTINFGRYLYIPEDFVREQERLFSEGAVYQSVATILSIVLWLLVLYVLIRARHGLKSIFKYILPFALVLAGLSILTIVTGYSELLFAYPTSIPLPGYLLQSSVGILIALIIEILLLLIIGLAAPVAGKDTHQEVPLTASQLLPQGICVGSILLAYSALLYVVGENFGVWMSLDFGALTALASPLPFVIPIYISLSAALAEEFLYRFFAIRFLERFIKSEFITILIPAVLWAFLHSTYEVYPMYFRGIELTIAGIILGYVYKRLGIQTAILAHYVTNIVLFSIPLLMSAQGYYRFSGIVSLLSVFGIAYLIRYSFAILSKSKQEKVEEEVTSNHNVS